MGPARHTWCWTPYRPIDKASVRSLENFACSSPKPRSSASSPSLGSSPSCQSNSAHSLVLCGPRLVTIDFSRFCPTFKPHYIRTDALHYLSIPIRHHYPNFELRGRRLKLPCRRLISHPIPESSIPHASCARSLRRLRALSLHSHHRSFDRSPTPTRLRPRPLRRRAYDVCRQVRRVLRNMHVAFRAQSIS